MEAEFSQFDLQGGDICCMPASLCYARLFVDHEIDRDDMHRLLYAGVTLQDQWMASKAPNEPRMQCWPNVRRVFPSILDGVKLCFEGNGFTGVDHATEATVTFAQVMDALEHANARVAGVLTSNNSSYGVGYEPGLSFFHAFNPHGGGTDHGGAVMRRTRDRDVFTTYVVNDLLRARTVGAEFHCVLFCKPPPP